MKKIAKVLLPYAFDKPFDYEIPNIIENLEVGDIVCVPFSGRNEIGVILSICTEYYNYPFDTEQNTYKLKKVISKSNYQKLTPKMIEFVKWVSDYNLIPVGNVLSMVVGSLNAFKGERVIDLYKINEQKNLELEKFTEKQSKIISFLKLKSNEPADSKTIKNEIGIAKSVLGTLEKRKILEKIQVNEDKIDLQNFFLPFNLNPLSSEQQQATEFISRRIDENKFSVTLIEGITSSGKTEVFFHSIAKILEKGRGQILLLLPEIVLTSQIINRFEKQFGFRPALWHSQIPASQKKNVWNGLQNNNVKIVVGARSALFLPFSNLSLIVVDEEHDSSFKQVDMGAYHGRDMAIVRAKFENIPIVLSTATPSLETIINVKKGRYHHLELPKRFGGASTPKTEIVDLRIEKLQRHKFISSKLKSEIGEVLLLSKQSMLYLNRRGYAPVVLCKECGEKIQCPNCSIYLTEHKSFNRLMCHHCGYFISKPKSCKQCGKEDAFFSFGPGVEKIVEEIEESFPNAKIGLMTSDTIKGTKDAERFVKKILEGEIDIIIGTQLIAKSHHFPNLTLVGVIDADAGLFGGGLKTSERAYQMLMQVAGRAGRGRDEGKVVFQTYSPDNLVLQSIINGDKEKLFRFEISTRQLVKLPPFGRMIEIVVGSKKEDQAMKISKMIVIAFPSIKGLEVFGPNPANPYKVGNRYRYKVLVKTGRNVNIQGLVKSSLKNVKIPSNVRIRINVDPIE